jgi:endonuclease/exonuclease/phosphatase family metal-dependent hydrolase
MTIGKTEQWLKLSDHMPVIVEIELVNNMDT